MKSENLLMAGAAAVLLFVVYQVFKGRAAAAGPVASVAPDPNAYTTTITPPGSNGWQYFSDGTAIDPSGNYYHQGILIYKAQP